MDEANILDTVVMGMASTMDYLPHILKALAIPYDLWMKFFGKLWEMWIAAACIIMMVCVVIGY